MSEKSVVLEVIKETMFKHILSYRQLGDKEVLSNMRLFYFYILENGFLEKLNEKQKEYNDFSCDIFKNEIILIFSKPDAELEYNIKLRHYFDTESFDVDIIERFENVNTHSLPNGEETFIERHDEFLKDLGYDEQEIDQTHLQNKIEEIEKQEQQLLQQRQKYQIELGKLRAKE